MRWMRWVRVLAEEFEKGLRTGLTTTATIDSIPGILISGNPNPGMPILAWIHYNLSYIKY
jgi:hypothetical protein